MPHPDVAEAVVFEPRASLAAGLSPSVRAPSLASMTVEELERMRTDRDPVPASRYGLERICGASCETAAH